MTQICGTKEFKRKSKLGEDVLSYYFKPNKDFEKSRSNRDSHVVTKSLLCDPDCNDVLIFFFYFYNCS